MSRLVLILSVISGLLSGCAGKSVIADGDASLTEQAPATPAYMKQIPADTPYLLAGTQRMPLDVFTAYMQGYGGVVERLQEQIETSAQDMPAGPKLAFSLVTRLSEAYGAGGLASIGMGKSAYVAVYGVGPFPVYRLELKDGEKFERMLKEAEAEAGYEPDMRMLGEQTYRFYDIDGAFMVAVAITETEVIAGAAPAAAFDQFLGYMLGATPLEASLADTGQLEGVIKEHGFEAFGAGYVDLRQLVGVFSGAQAPGGVMAEMMEAADLGVAQLEEACQVELMAVMDEHPRAVFGYTDFSPMRLGFRFGVESTSEMPARIAQVVSGLRYFEGRGEGAMAVGGLGIDVGGLLELAGEVAQEIVADPYQCSDWERVNELAGQAGAFLPQAPRFIRDIQGVHVELKGIELDPDTMQLRNVDGLAVVETKNPGILLAQLKLMIPQLSEVVVKPDGVPVATQPFEPAPVVDMPERGTPSRSEPVVQAPHVAMTAGALAASVGLGMQDELAVMLEDQGSVSDDGRGVFMAFGYDYARLFEQYTAILQNTGADLFGLDDMMSAFGFAAGSFSVEPGGYFMSFVLELDPAAAKESAAP